MSRAHAGCLGRDGPGRRAGARRNGAGGQTAIDTSEYFCGNGLDLNARMRDHMSTVPIKDEHRVGTEARFKVEPSAYLQKLHQTGTPDLSWMKETGEWGMRAKPSGLGLRLKDVEVGSYGVVPERGGAHLSMAPRGSVIPDNVPSLGFTINNKDECWADNVTELYEEAVARQWSSARDIPWDELKPLPDDLERAMCQLCTFLTEVEFIAADAPTRWMSRINQDFFEVKLFLATQAMDEARHMDVFRKRALANGGGLGKASAYSELGLKKIFDAPSFSAQTGRLHLLGEGFVLTIFRQGEFIAPSRVDQEIFRRCMQDESRHVGYGTMHLRTQLKSRPELADEIHTSSTTPSAFCSKFSASPNRSSRWRC